MKLSKFFAAVAIAAFISTAAFAAPPMTGNTMHGKTMGHMSTGKRMHKPMTMHGKMHGKRHRKMHGHTGTVHAQPAMHAKPMMHGAMHGGAMKPKNKMHM